MEIVSKAKELIDKYKKLNSKKKTYYIAIIIIIAVILVIYFSSFWPAETTSEESTAEAEVTSESSADDYEQQIKEDLESTLSKISGAGEVTVMITYETSEEIVPAIVTDKQTTNTSDSSDSSDKTSQTENEESEVVKIQNGSDEEALIITQKLPKVLGVIVIAEGANDIAVRLNLQRAVQTIMGVEAQKVEIFEMSK
ncbi:MAG: hypothetical protein R2876_03200 [Eubacteriales bacterium]